MANAPITIGELTNVPAPLSPIQSKWAQDVSSRVVQRFTTAAARAAQWPTPPAGAISIAFDRNYPEFYDGTAWQRVGGGASLNPVYSPPAGTGTGNALRGGETSRIARFTIPSAMTARFTHSVLLSSTAAATGKLDLYYQQTSTALWSTYVKLTGADFVTAHIVAIAISGLAAGALIDVRFNNDASSAGQVAWYSDLANNRGRADLNVLAAT